MTAAHVIYDRRNSVQSSQVFLFWGEGASSPGAEDITKPVDVSSLLQQPRSLYFMVKSQSAYGLPGRFIHRFLMTSAVEGCYTCGSF